jgi:hypothetical protein
MFVTLKVFKLIGPSNDGRRHGRGPYLFLHEKTEEKKEKKINRKKLKTLKRYFI